jgi:hypothetical protein
MAFSSFEPHIVIATTKVITHFPAKDAMGFYSKLRKEEVDAENLL